MVSPSPCSCRGSIGIHEACLKKVQERTMCCPVCRTDYASELDGIHSRYVGERRIVYSTVGGLRHGTYEEYDADDVLLKRSCFVAGVLHGPYYVYHEDGETLMIECTYVAGKKEGYLYEYDEDQNMITLSHYRNDLLDGWCREYYDRGRVFQEYCMSEGVRDGEFTEFHYDGTVKSRCFYEDGVAVAEEPVYSM